MNQLDLFVETIASYRKHGWQVQRLLMCKATADAFGTTGESGIEGIVPEVTLVDALWFSRPSHNGRVAWELRLVGETPYALFEAFEADCTAELREEMMCDMQKRLIEYATGV